jgi:hypothetical protein
MNVLERTLRTAGLGDPALLSAAARMAPDGLFSPQRRAFAESGLLRGESTLVVAPTGSGKSLLADAAALLALGRKQIVLQLVPSRALLRERAGYLSGILGPAGLRVLAATRDDREADEEIRGGRVDVIVAAYEKARSLSLSCPGLFASLGLVVADELQLLHDAERGPAAELLLQVCRRRAPGLQLVALTADPRGMNPIAARLGLARWETAERVVPLRIGVVHPGTGACRWQDEETEEDFPADLPGMVARLQPPVLVFVPSRCQASELAHALAESLPAVPDAAGPCTHGPLDELLAKGVGLHTTDLTRCQRQRVEGALRAGELRACVATTTLGDGLNLPVRSVVVIPPVGFQWKANLGSLIGRTGRPGTGAGTALIVSPDAQVLDHQAGSDKHACLSDGAAMERVAFALAALPDLGPAALEELAAPEGGLEGVLAKGVQHGMWELGADRWPRLTAGGELLAQGGTTAVVLAGWRCLLRRFEGDFDCAAGLFAALGTNPACHVVPLGAGERDAGGWLEQLRDRLRADPSPLSLYLRQAVAAEGRVSRLTHLAAKGTLLALAAWEGTPPERLSEEFAVAPGVAEEFVETARFQLGQFTRLAHAMGRRVALPPPAAEAAAAVAEDPPARHVPIPAIVVAAPPAVRLVIRHGTTGLVSWDGREAALTKLQFRMLDLLARHAGEGLPYERVERYVWQGGVVERQQVFFHRRRIEERLGTEGLIETHATWGLRLLLEPGEVRIEGVAEGEAALLREAAAVIPINLIAREVG